jgi:hypothetical protein
MASRGTGTCIRSDAGEGGARSRLGSRGSTQHAKRPRGMSGTAECEGSATNCQPGTHYGGLGAGARCTYSWAGILPEFGAGTDGPDKHIQQQCTLPPELQQLLKTLLVYV